MGTGLADVVVAATQPAALARFWATLLQRPLVRQDDDAAAVNLGDEVDLVFTRLSAAPKQVKNRLHPDLASTSADDQVAIVDQALALGAVHVDIGQQAVPWVVLADPEGNEFCVLEPREQYLGIGRLAALVIDALDPQALVRFWAQATGLPVARDHPEYASLRQEGGFWLEFVRVAEPKRTPNRVCLDLAAEGEPADEVARLTGHGAVLLNAGSGDVVTLADPEGNELRLHPRRGR